MSKLICSSAIDGATEWVAKAEAKLAEAIAAKGESCPVAFPNTAYFLPVIYSFTGEKVATLGDMRPILQRAKALLPMNDLAATAKIDSADFVESLWKEGVRQGNQYWIPFARSTPLFYYNADMFKAAGLPDRGPKTWTEFSEWAPKLVKMDGSTMKVAAFAGLAGVAAAMAVWVGAVWLGAGLLSIADAVG